jgi:transposase
MMGNPGIHVLSDARWAELEPLIDEVRPRCKVPHENLRRTIEAIPWRRQNGAKWRSIPGELGPWWKAAQTFIRWARLGVRERLLDLVQRRGVALGMTFLDGTNVRAHQKAAGARKGGPTARSAAAVRRLAVLVAATAPRPA